MRHLAQVKHHLASGGRELQLLAYQPTEQTWEMMTPQTVVCSQADEFNEGMLVVVELGEKQQILVIEDAKEWVLRLIQDSIQQPLFTPEWIEEEKQRIEQSRQEITAKNLDLTRRQLELETHREQVQELEANLKREQEKLAQKMQALNKTTDLEE